MISWYRFIIFYALFLGAAVYMNFHHEVPTPLDKPLAQFPAQLGSWRMVHQDFFNQALLAVLRPADYLSRRYQDADGKNVDLYIGYHDGAQNSGPIHSPKNCLPGSGWYEVFSKPMVVSVQGKSVELTQAVYRQEDRQEFFVYWFLVRGQALSNEVSLKLAEIVNSVCHGQRGASFIRLSLPAGDNPAEALSTVESFLRQAYPAIHDYLPS